MFKDVVKVVSQAVADACPCPNSTTDAPPVPVMVTLAARTNPTNGIGERPAKMRRIFLLDPDLAFPPPKEPPSGVWFFTGLTKTFRLTH